MKKKDIVPFKAALENFLKKKKWIKKTN